MSQFLFVLNQPNSVATIITNQYKAFLDVDPTEFSSKRIDFKLPTFPEEDLCQLCQLTQQSVSDDPIVLNLTSPIVIVGDLHGQILDLFRILRKFGLPNNTKYLFLGDIVDRGEFSIETATFIFALRVLYPQNVFILRGNHEFSQLCGHCGFMEEIVKAYGSEKLFTSFIDAFNYLPLVSIVDQYIICVHGGIGPNWNSITQISNYRRPIEHYNEETISSMLWSDPSNNVLDYSESQRGVGYVFGQSALIEFLNKNKAKMLIRGHECFQEGYQFMFGNRLVTVFSASNYCGLVNNDAGVIIIKPKLKYEVRTFPPLEYIKRSETSFFPHKVVNSSSLEIFGSIRSTLPNPIHEEEIQENNKSLTIPSLIHNGQARRYSTTRILKAERRASVLLESTSMRSGLASQSIFKAKMGTLQSRPLSLHIRPIKSILPT